MKKRFKQLAALCLAGCLWMTGCGGTGDQKETESKNEETTKKVEAGLTEPKVTKMMVGKQLGMTGVSVHDPSIFKDTDGTYYVFGSHLAQATSTDLIKWKYLGEQGYGNRTVYGSLKESLAGSFAWAGLNDQDCKGGYAVWAPDVTYNEKYVWPDGSTGAYMMYYSTSSTYCRSSIGYAVSKTMAGPFNYVDTLICSGFTPNSNPITTSSAMGTKTVNTQYTNTNIVSVYEKATGKSGITLSDLNPDYFKGNDYNTNLFPNAIDPCIYYDTDGRMWMGYGSWSGGIYLLELDRATGQAIHPTEIVKDGNHLTDIYFGKKIAGGYGHSGEGPYVLYDKDTEYYYLFMSYAYLTANSGYNIRMFRSKNPDGPFVDAAGNEATWGGGGHDNVGVKVMGSYSLPCLVYDYMAPGHNSALLDDDGRMYLVYHQRFSTGNEGHEMRVHQMVMNEDGWPCVLPFAYAGETIDAAGVSASDMTGTYYLLTQRPTDNKTADQPRLIGLQEDGTLYLQKFNKWGSSGSWKVKEGTNYFEIEVEGQTYKGIVGRMKDEAGTDCVVFSAIGANNATLWGIHYPQ